MERQDKKQDAALKDGATLKPQGRHQDKKQDAALKGGATLKP